MAILPRQVIEFLEDRCHDGFRLTLLTNVIRLYRVDHAPVLIGEWGDLPGALLEGVLRGSDEEFKLVRIGRRVAPAVEDRHLVDQRVESSAQLVEHLAKVESKLLPWKGVGDLDVEDSFPIVLYVQDRVIGFAVVVSDELVPYPPELTLMHLGTLKPGTWPVQPPHC